VLIYQGAAPAAWITNLTTAIHSVVASANVTVATPTDLAGALVGKSALIIADQNGANASAIATTNYRALNDFANRGGLVVATEGLDSAGVPSATSLVLVNSGLMAIGAAGASPASSSFILAAGDDPLVKTTNGLSLVPSPLPAGTVEFSPAIATQSGSGSTKFLDGVPVLRDYGPTTCIAACLQNLPIIQYRVVHVVEGFDNVPAANWPTSPWTLDTGAAAGAFVTGRDEVAGITNVGWSSSLFQDTGTITDRVSAWILVESYQVRLPINIGMNSNGGGVTASLMGNGTANTYTLGFTTLSSTHAETTVSGPSVLLNNNQWYRFDLVSTGVRGSYEAQVWDANLNLVALYDGTAGGPTSGGVIFRVPANMVMDTITTYEAPASLGGLGNTSGNTNFQAVCPAGTGIIGFYGYASATIDRLGVHCGAISVLDAGGGNFTFTSGAVTDLQWWAATDTGGTTAFDERCPADFFVTDLSVTVGDGSTTPAIARLQFNCSRFSATGSAGRLAVYRSGTSLDPNIIGSGANQTLVTTPVSCEQAFQGMDQIMDQVSINYGTWAPTGARTTLGVGESCRPIYNW
jgi:hypothetical protein